MPQVYRVAARLLGNVDRITECGETNSIPLFAEQLNERSRRVYRKFHFVELNSGTSTPLGDRIVGVVHAAAGIHHQLAPQVGLFLVPLSVELIRSRVKLPVDMPRAFTLVIRPVLRELHTEAMERTLMQPRQKALDHLPRFELECA